MIWAFKIFLGGGSGHHTAAHLAVTSSRAMVEPDDVGLGDGPWNGVALRSLEALLHDRIFVMNGLRWDYSTGYGWFVPQDATQSPYQK